MALASPEPELPTLHLDLSVDPLEVRDCESDYDDCDDDNDDNDDMQIIRTSHPSVVIEIYQVGASLNATMEYCLYMLVIMIS